ncbi:uncharacterized protein LOC120791068 [Xiphias gladius]|uniref:uncharacterized protein LOC120791068 n=1 Tax=Xiphias gladius TaxID=8245 RepID=UPI001A996856|nr:uncharacterized protein LOC120791068 [Xiphias gladius]
MADNIVTKPVGLILIATAHMVFNGPSKAEVTGILGSNITLQFRFNNTTIHDDSHFAVYTTGQKKIDEYSKHKCFSGKGHLYPKNTSVLYHITNLKLNQSGTYWASLFMGSGLPKESDKVQLIVQKERRHSTVPPVSTTMPLIGGNGSSSVFSSHIITLLVVSPVVLLASVLPWLIWCLMRTKDKQQQPQGKSNPIERDTAEEPSRVAPPSLVYSVLDFPKRPPTVLEINPNDTEYAAVSYLPEERRE